MQLCIYTYTTARACAFSSKSRSHVASRLACLSSASMFTARFRPTARTAGAPGGATGTQLSAVAILSWASYTYTYTYMCDVTAQHPFP